MVRTGFYAGSFDPVTFGHVDVIKRASATVDRLVLAIGVHHGKIPFLDSETRVNLLKKVAAPIAIERGCDIEVVTFDNLVVEAAADHGASILIRGLRDATDYAYEMQMAGMNAELSPGIETVFLPARGPVRHIASSLVKQIAVMGGDVSHFVPDFVAAKITETLDKN
ncbi:MAG: pantetheine-phosphate adenylyltransferase [Hyphomicrobiales bacterium]